MQWLVSLYNFPVKTYTRKRYIIQDLVKIALFLIYNETIRVVMCITRIPNG